MWGSEHADQIKWELLKYEIRKFAITYSRKIAKSTRANQHKSEKKPKEVESNLNSEEKFSEYTKCKSDTDLIYGKKAQMLKLEAYVNGIKKVKTQLHFWSV